MPEERNQIKFTKSSISNIEVIRTTIMNANKRIVIIRIFQYNYLYECKEHIWILLVLWNLQNPVFPFYIHAFALDNTID